MEIMKQISDVATRYFTSEHILIQLNIIFLQ